MNFMIFNDVAVNMALVEQIEPDGYGNLKLCLSSGSYVLVFGVTIDDILTALAAGQSRVAASVSVASDRALSPNLQGEPMPRLKGRHRFREPQRNDPQAMRSIGRRHKDDD